MSKPRFLVTGVTLAVSIVIGLAPAAHASSSAQIRLKPQAQAVAQPATGDSSQFTSGAQVDAYLTQAHFRGYALLIRRGQELLSKGYGMADSRHNIPNTIHTRWPMFGMQGFMEAMVILKLQEQGKLSVRDKLCRYLAPCPTTWRQITLHHLLVGTSGINEKGNFFGSPGRKAQTVRACRKAPLSGPPGTLLDDNPCNRVLLSVVIAKVAKQSFNTVMQRMVFGPAGMTESSVVTQIPSGSARGYLRGTPSYRLYSGRYPLIYSSVEDVMRLDRALLGGKIISKRSQAALFTAYINDNPGGPPVYRGYGQTLVLKPHQFPGRALGTVSPVNTEKIAFQNGGIDGSGFITNNALSPNDGTIAIILNNDAGMFTNDNDNYLKGHLFKLLWAK